MKKFAMLVFFTMVSAQSVWPAIGATRVTDGTEWTIIIVEENDYTLIESGTEWMMAQQRAIKIIFEKGEDRIIGLFFNETIKPLLESLFINSPGELLGKKVKNPNKYCFVRIEY